MKKDYVLSDQKAGTRRKRTAKNSRRPRIIQSNEQYRENDDKNATEWPGPCARKANPTLLIDEAISPRAVSGSTPSSTYKNVANVDIPIITTKK